MPLGVPVVSVAASPHVVRALATERRRDWVQRAGACAPRAPMWTSRAGWLDGLRQWAYSPDLGHLCAQERVSITSATLLSIAVVMAEHADHATGRHVAVTRATIAARVGCDVRTVTAAWRVLRVSQWAVEAQRGHGSPGTPSIGRRPSVYHLVSRREPRPVVVSVTRRLVHDFHLPPSGGVGSLPHVEKYSPSGRVSAPAKNISDNTPRRTRHWRATARPLAIQRLAAEFVATTHGLDRAHIGTICDALTAAGIDPTVWSARAVNAKLNADMHARAVSWPDHIANPGAFLASRLRRLSWTPPQAPPDASTMGSAAASLDQTPRPVVLTAASRARIAAARDDIRRILTDTAQRTRSAHINATPTIAVNATTMTPGRWHDATNGSARHTTHGHPALNRAVSQSWDDTRELYPRVWRSGQRPPTIHSEPAVAGCLFTGDQPPHHGERPWPTVIDQHGH